MIACADRTWTLQLTDALLLADLTASVDTETACIDALHDAVRLEVIHDGADDASLRIVFDACTIELQLTRTGEDAVEIASTLVNTSAVAMRVRAVQPLRHVGEWGSRGPCTVASSARVHTVPFERFYGFDGARGIDRNEPHTSHWFAAVEDGARSITWSIASVPAGFVRWHVTPLQSHTPGRRVLQWSCDIDVMSGMRGVLLAAGVRLALGTVRLALERLPAPEALRAAARRCAAVTDVSLPPHPPTGWCSWYAVGPEVTADLVRTTLDTLESDMARSLFDVLPPLEVVQIDDGWMRVPGTRTTGAPRVDERKFPEGMAAIAAEIAAHGRVPGLWLRPFEGWPDTSETPAWARGRCIDLSDDGALEWVRGLARRVVGEWGFRYLKIDFASYDMFGAWGMELTHTRGARLRPRDETRTNAQLMRAGFAALREGAGQDVYIVGCNVPLGCAIGLVDGMRIGDDVDAANDDRTRTMGMGAIDALGWMNGVLWWIDPDVVLLAPASGAAFAREWADRVTAAAGAVFIS